MNELLALLKEIGVDPRNPPSWEDIRIRLVSLDTAKEGRLGRLVIRHSMDLVTNLELHHTLYIRLLCAVLGVSADKDVFDKFLSAFFEFVARCASIDKENIEAAVGILYENCRWNIDGDGAIVRMPNSEHRYRVLLGLDQVFLHGGISKKGDAEYSRTKLRINLDRLKRDLGLPFPTQADLFTCWLAAMDYDQPGVGEVVCAAVEDFLEFHVRHTHDEIFGGKSVRLKLPADTVTGLCIVKCLAFWLRAAPDSSRIFDVAKVGRVAKLVLESIELDREKHAELATNYDWNIGWGYFVWALSALAASFNPWMPDEDIKPLLVRYLELLSGQIAINDAAIRDVIDKFGRTTNTVHKIGSRDGATSVGLNRQSELVHDQFAALFPSGKRWRIGGRIEDFLKGVVASFRDSNPASTSSETATLAEQIPREFYRIATDVPDVSMWHSLIPRDAAFLGLYELPFSHRPIAVLVTHVEDEVIVEMATDPSWSSRAAAQGRSALPHDLKELKIGPNLVVSQSHLSSIRYQRLTEDYWSQHGQTTGNKRRFDVQSLSSSLVSSFYRFHELQINPMYGPLIDLIVERTNERLERAGQPSLVSRDLIYCPRGPVAAAVPFFLGRKIRLGVAFRSITTAPSLGIFKLLYNRARQMQLKEKPRLNLISWFQADSAEAAVATKLFERATSELVDEADLWIAANSPMASVARTGMMTQEGDWTLLLAHGRNGPTGVKMADGIFPIDFPPCDIQDRNYQGGSVLFLLSCVAGRMTQTEPFVDSFGPITDEVLLSFCLKNRLKRKPTLVGSFTQPVLAEAAADLGVDLAKRRLALTPGRANWSSFAQIYQQIVSEQIQSSPFASAMKVGGILDNDSLRNWAGSPNGSWEFLKLHAGFHFRLIGCEPTRTV